MRRFAAILMAVLECSACGPGRPLDTSFHGTWIHTSINGLTNEKSQETVSVSADHDRYKKVTTAPDEIGTEVFDGHILYSKTVFSTDPSSVQEQQRIPTGNLSRNRFWAHAWMNGENQAGGLVAGRDTILYKIHTPRSDGTIDLKEWVDAKTGVLLRSITSMYSSQAQSLVNEDDWECSSIDYGPVEARAFEKP